MTSPKKLTLIEILLIIMLLSISAAVIIGLTHFFSHSPTPKTDSQKFGLPSMQNSDNKSCLHNEQYLEIQNALKFYKLDNGFYPSQQQGLNALIQKPTTPPIPEHWRQYLNKISPEYSITLFINY